MGDSEDYGLDSSLFDDELRTPYDTGGDPEDLLSLSSLDLQDPAALPDPTDPTAELAALSGGGLSGAGFGTGGLTMQEKLATVIASLLPLGIAAARGKPLGTAASAGAGAAATGLKLFGEDAKRRQALEILGLKGKQTLALQGAKEKAATTRQIALDKSRSADWDRKHGLQRTEKDSDYARSLEDRHADMDTQFRNQQELVRQRAAQSGEEQKADPVLIEMHNTNAAQAEELSGTKIPRADSNITNKGLSLLNQQLSQFIRPQLQEKRADTSQSQWEQRHEVTRGEKVEDYGQQRTDKIKDAETLEQSRRDFLTFKIDAEAKAKGGGSPAAPELIEMVNVNNRQLSDISGKELPQLPDTATLKDVQTANFIGSNIGVSARQNQKLRFTEATQQVSGVEHAVPGGRFSNPEKKVIQGSLKSAPEVLRLGTQLEQLYDPKNGVPWSEVRGNTPEARAIITARGQRFEALVAAVKNMQGYGANFTITEQGIVRTQIGATPPPIDADKIRAYFQKQVVQGSDYQDALKRFNNDMATIFFETVKANNGKFDAGTYASDAVGIDFVKRLLKTSIGQRQLDGTELTVKGKRYRVDARSRRLNPVGE